MSPKSKTTGKVKCWEVFSCKEKECPAYKSKNLMCWLFSGTHCRDQIQGKFIEKMEMCVNCEPFIMNMDVSAMKETVGVISRQFKEYRNAIEERETELRTISNEMAVGISETFEGLRKIASGDPTVRIDEESGIEVISKLKHVVNITAVEIGEIVNQSHEIAIAIAEHFDVLHKVTKGDLDARVESNSKIALMDSLKREINNTIVSISREITDRKQMEEVLRLSESKHRTLLENLPQKIFLKDINSVYIYCNKNYAIDLKIKSDEIVGRIDHDFYPKELAEKYRADDKKILESGQTQDIEEQYIQSGKEVIVHTVKTPVKDEEGNIIGILGIFWDITEQKRDEEVLVERTRDLWERVKELRCLYGVLELIEDESVSLEEIYQRTVKRMPFAWRYPEITCARIIVNGQEFRTKNFEETVWRQSSIIMAKDKTAGTVEVCYLEERRASDEGPFQKEERNLLNAIAKHLGRIIDRKKAEETLKESEEKYRTLFESTGNAMIITEEDTTISLTNTRFEKLSGYSKKEIEGKKSWTEFFVKDDLNGLKEYHLMRRITPKAALQNYEAQFINRQGQIRDVLLTVSTIPGTKKSVESLLDITERKKLEEQMYQTEKLASIGTLAAGVAHEINNPLAIMLGFTDVLLEKVPENPEFNDLLNTIKKHGINAKRIVENLLSFTRYEEHKEEDVDINNCIESVIALEGNRLSVNNISVKRDVEESLPVIKGNPDELQQVFFNIINNAAYAMKEGGVLAIQTRAEDDRKNIKIRISDTGIGIRPEHRSRIFDPLFTTKKVGEGTGLGLTVSYAIVKKLGGEIVFETKTEDKYTDTGTTFIITLPVM